LTSNIPIEVHRTSVRVVRVGFSVYGTRHRPVAKPLATAFPASARAVSDFEVTHQFNRNWIAEHPLAPVAQSRQRQKGLLDAFIGGWQTEGVASLDQRIPLSVDGGQRWPTDCSSLRSLRGGGLRNPDRHFQGKTERSTFWLIPPRRKQA